MTHMKLHPQVGPKTTVKNISAIPNIRNVKKFYSSQSSCFKIKQINLFVSRIER